nr:MAG TPA: hypothetical protein [Caudoviricetes sp.]
MKFGIYCINFRIICYNLIKIYKEDFNVKF